MSRINISRHRGNGQCIDDDEGRQASDDEETVEAIYTFGFDEAEIFHRRQSIFAIAERKQA